MNDWVSAVTGANGLLGSHIVERLCARGEHVRAVVRPGADTTFLKQLGVDIAIAALDDAAALRRAVDGAAVVYHAGARVSDWGPWADFAADNVEGTRRVLEASRAAGAARVLYVSSISVYGRSLPPGLVTEDAPLARADELRRWDYYGRSKVLAEAVARAFGSLVTVVRPTWCYGPRDRGGIPRVIDNLRRGRASVIGPGDNVLNLLHARDAAEGAVLAAGHPAAAGRSYNLGGAGDVTQRQFFDAITDGLGLPPLRKHVSPALATRGALLVELIGRLIRKRTPPRYTRRALDRIARTMSFSTERARLELGWTPRVAFAEGMLETIAWYLQSERRGANPPAPRTPAGATPFTSGGSTRGPG